MSKLTKGEVTLMLAGTEHTLKPSLQAFSVLGSRYANHGELLNQIVTGNVPAIISVLRHGLGFNDKQAKALPGLVFETGVPALTEPVSDFVFRLFNGGKSPEEVMAEQSAAASKKEPAVAPAGKPESAEDDNPLLAD